MRLCDPVHFPKGRVNDILRIQEVFAEKNVDRHAEITQCPIMDIARDKRQRRAVSAQDRKGGVEVITIGRRKVRPAYVTVDRMPLGRGKRRQRRPFAKSSWMVAPRDDRQ